MNFFCLTCLSELSSGSISAGWDGLGAGLVISGVACKKVTAACQCRLATWTKEGPWTAHLCVDNSNRPVARNVLFFLVSFNISLKRACTHIISVMCAWFFFVCYTTCHDCLIKYTRTIRKKGVECHWNFFYGRIKSKQECQCYYERRQVGAAHDNLTHPHLTRHVLENMGSRYLTAVGPTVAAGEPSQPVTWVILRPQDKVQTAGEKYEHRAERTFGATTT